MSGRWLVGAGWWSTAGDRRLVAAGLPKRSLLIPVAGCWLFIAALQLHAAALF